MVTAEANTTLHMVSELLTGEHTHSRETFHVEPSTDLKTPVARLPSV